MKALLLALSVLLLAAPAARADSVVQFAAPNLRAPDDPDVSGARFSVFYGKNRRIRGIDLGLFSLSETEHLVGFRSIVGVGKVTGTSTGLANAVMNVHTGVDTGVNAAFLNHVNTMKNGVDIAFVNVADGYSMVDLGGINVSDRSTVQLGFVNMTKEISAVQLGFLNIAENGFLPIFPFFNFPK